ncbi:hypothetical protein EMCRGX_G018028 [Ephydatia muelleri]
MIEDLSGSTYKTTCASHSDPGGQSCLRENVKVHLNSQFIILVLFYQRDLMVVAYSPLRTKTKATCCSWSLADCEGCGYPVGSRDSERV